MKMLYLKKVLLSMVFAFFGTMSRGQKFEHLAATPPMGWNSWNTFQLALSERLIVQTADKLVSSGMKAAGYCYVILDDGWMERSRDSAGNLVADRGRFPHGIRWLADYVHGKGLK